ncbi:MAG: hypothetical protein M3362_05655 [Acidobacteriota bacterium]|nr:hypothetical protein [Acidobacteriota bacterium]
MKNDQKRIIITIDVEAQPQRQSSDHVERLIWGRFADNEMGIGQMIEIADRYGRMLTFFVDFCEAFMYPGAFEKVADYIVSHGHDLQLHAHPEFLPDDFWTSRGLVPKKMLPGDYTQDYAEPLMDFLVGYGKAVGGRMPIAFRGGSYRYNHEILKAMERAGLVLSFNYNTSANHQLNNEENISVFNWSNGITEVPIGNLYLDNRLKVFNFNSGTDFSDTKFIRKYIKKYFAEFGPNAVLSLVMHSWSFLYPSEETGHFEYRDNHLRDKFESFLANLPRGVEVVTASQLSDLIREKKLKVERVRDIEILDKQKYPLTIRNEGREADDSRFYKRVEEIVKNTVPPSATIAVISHGDDKLLELSNRRGWHLPQVSEGVYAGYQPENAAEAISQLETLRDKGADFLLIPGQQFWWLDYYGKFRQHLNGHYSVVAYQEDTCVIYSLRNGASNNKYRLGISLTSKSKKSGRQK